MTAPHKARTTVHHIVGCRDHRKSSRPSAADGLSALIPAVEPRDHHGRLPFAVIAAFAALRVASASAISGLEGWS
jgi:hypothetical protein